MYRSKKIETKRWSEHCHYNYKNSISRRDTKLGYYGIGGPEGKGRKYKEDIIHGAIVDLREGGGSGVEEGQLAVYIRVFIEMRRKRRMEVFEDQRKILVLWS